MPFNGSGEFNLVYNWEADAAAGIDIIASRMDGQEADMASNGFDNCLTRDGQGSPTATLPMNGYRHTGVGDGQTQTDYASLGQAQFGLVNWSIAGGTSDAITAIYTPTFSVLSDGQLCCFRASAANTTTTPTFSPNGITACTITKEGGIALAVGDIPGNLAEVVLRYNLSNTRWELLNLPPNTFGSGTATIASATTTDLGASNASYQTITGTTTITSFGSTAATGTVRNLKFSGALILTYNGSSLILPNNTANITTAAGDTALAIALGSGNWIVTQYQRASGQPLETLPLAIGMSITGGTNGDVLIQSAGVLANLPPSIAISGVSTSLGGTYNPSWVTSHPSNETLTSPGSGGKMFGFAGSITPNTTGTVRFDARFDYEGSAAGFNLYCGTGSAPSPGAAPTGTIVGYAALPTINTSTSSYPILLSGIITGLTVGTTYWFDVLGAASSGNILGANVTLIGQEK